MNKGSFFQSDLLTQTLLLSLSLYHNLLPLL